MFECLKTSDPNVVKTASDILQHLLNLSDPALVLDRYKLKLIFLKFFLKLPFSLYYSLVILQVRGPDV